MKAENGLIRTEGLILKLIRISTTTPLRINCRQKWQTVSVIEPLEMFGRKKYLVTFDYIRWMASRVYRKKWAQKKPLIKAKNVARMIQHKYFWRYSNALWVCFLSYLILYNRIVKYFFEHYIWHYSYSPPLV